MPFTRLFSRALASVLVVLSLASVATVADTPLLPTTPAGAATAIRLTPAEQHHLDLLNDWRSRRGLARLAVDPAVQVHAREWTASMAARNTLSHDPTVRDDCFAASSTCSGWGENVGYSSGGDATTASATIFRNFEASAGHAANMASGAWSRVGIGVHRDASGRVWVTQRYATCSCANDAVAVAQNDRYAAFEGYVAALSLDFLGQQPRSDLAVRAGTLLYGTPLEEVVAGFAYSDAWFAALIDGYYRATLGRPADAEGVRYWISVLRGGTSPAEVAAAFYASDEYFRRAGGTNRDWIRDLYVQILDRQPEKRGLDHWTAIADRGVSRTDVASAFHQSLESRLTRVGALYQDLLGRYPDRHGWAYWADVLRDGHDVRLAMFLASSQEYFQRVT